MPIISIAMALAQFAPSLLKLFGAGEPTVSMAEKVVGIAQAVTGTSSPEEALAAMKISQEAQAAFHMAVLQQQTELEKLYSVERIALEATVTQRLGIDMASDSWLSKNIRPLVLIYLLVNVTLMGLKVLSLETAYIAMIREFTGYGLMFYFGGRTVEKIASVVGDVMKTKALK